MIVPQEVYGTDAVFQCAPMSPIQFFHHGQLGIPLPEAIALKVSDFRDAQLFHHGQLDIPLPEAIASIVSGFRDAQQELVVLNTIGTTIALRILV